MHLLDSLAQTCLHVEPIIHAEDCNETTRALARTPEYTLALLPLPLRTLGASYRLLPQMEAI